MPDLDFLAAAYENGQMLGRAIRWILLIAVGFKLVQRMLRGSWGPGFRRSPAGTAIGLVVVVVALAGSVHYDFVGKARANAQPDMAAERANIVSGCMNQGQTASICGCYADEVLRRTGNDAGRLAALEQDMVRRQDAGQGPPELVIRAAQACAGAAG